MKVNKKSIYVYTYTRQTFTHKQKRPQQYTYFKMATAVKHITIKGAIWVKIEVVRF